ncbi:PREDICTED: protein CASC3-like isoform X2 [Priapulus caudatus]|uniref:Protein CASC3 n=1 Tax=Priapulus caudatus TaxID=37621 RepID=A0ABM1E907_PRICU|nr:PREDICTED: protein CASC3-like isoform X2 [Priapulus caudatus]
MADRRRRRISGSDEEDNSSGSDDAVPKLKRASDCESEGGFDEKDVELSEYGSAEEDDKEDYKEKGESEELADYGDENLEKYLFPEPEEGEYDDVEEEKFIDKERESGDGQEEPAPKELDKDEDRQNPQYIPKKGFFYEHDTRMGDPKEELAKEEKLKKLKKLWGKEDEKWLHDAYKEDEQAPKSREELVALYGYDIRNPESDLKRRHRRKYTRGQAKYERDWKDVGAYRKELPLRRGRGGRGGPSYRGQDERDNSNEELNRGNDSTRGDYELSNRGRTQSSRGGRGGQRGFRGSSQGHTPSRDYRQGHQRSSDDRQDGEDVCGDGPLVKTESEGTAPAGTANKSQDMRQTIPKSHPSDDGQPMADKVSGPKAYSRVRSNAHKPREVTDENLATEIEKLDLRTKKEGTAESKRRDEEDSVQPTKQTSAQQKSPRTSQDSSQGDRSPRNNYDNKRAQVAPRFSRQEGARQEGRGAKRYSSQRQRNLPDSAQLPYQGAVLDVGAQFFEPAGFQGQVYPNEPPPPPPPPPGGTVRFQQPMMQYPTDIRVSSHAIRSQPPPPIPRSPHNRMVFPPPPPIPVSFTPTVVSTVAMSQAMQGPAPHYSTQGSGVSYTPAYPLPQAAMSPMQFPPPPPGPPPPCQGPPPPTEFSRGGVTYYAPEAQTSIIKKRSPGRRPKLAIPILPPPDKQEGAVDKKDDEEDMSGTPPSNAVVVEGDDDLQEMSADVDSGPGSVVDLSDRITPLSSTDAAVLPPEFVPRQQETEAASEDHPDESTQADETADSVTVDDQQQQEPSSEIMSPPVPGKQAPSNESDSANTSIAEEVRQKSSAVVDRPVGCEEPASPTEQTAVSGEIAVCASVHTADESRDTLDTSGDTAEASENAVCENASASASATDEMPVDSGEVVIASSDTVDTSNKVTSDATESVDEVVNEAVELSNEIEQGQS